MRDGEVINTDGMERQLEEVKRNRVALDIQRKFEFRYEKAVVHD